MFSIIITLQERNNKDAFSDLDLFLSSSNKGVIREENCYKFMYTAQGVLTHVVENKRSVHSLCFSLNLPAVLKVEFLVLLLGQSLLPPHRPNPNRSESSPTVDRTFSN